MNNAGKNLIQAIELQPGRYAVATGTFTDVHVVSCLEDGDITVAFKSGNETFSMLAGSDATVPNVSVTIVSGSFAVN